MKKIFISLFILIVSSLPALSQSFNVFDIDTTNFPIMKAKFYAFDSAGKQVFPSINDIIITEDGITRKVTNISCPTPKPPVAISSVLVIDVSGSMSTGPNGIANIDLAKTAANAWVNGLPAGNSECSITTFDDYNYLNQDFTKDRSKLISAISLIKPHSGTNYDAALLNPLAGGLQISKNGKNKKVIIFLSDGLPNQEPQTSQIILEAKKQNCVIYCVTLGMPAPQCMKDMANQTDGLYFENVTNKQDAEQVYNTLLQVTQEIEPCEISWESNVNCDQSFIQIRMNWQNIDFYYRYLSPLSSLVQLIMQPNFLTFKNKHINIKYDTIITIKAINSDFDINNIISSNPDYDINPKNFSLKKEESKDITISFTPKDSIYTFTKFNIQSNLCPIDYFTSSFYPKSSKKTSTLKLTFPNGGEKFIAGMDSIITWSGISKDEKVKLEYSIDSGNSWKLITYNATNLIYKWNNIPLPTSKKCLIKITQIAYQDSVPIIEWQKTIGGTQFESSNEIKQTNDGGYIFTGSSNSNDDDISGNHGNWDMIVIKLNNLGTIEWQKSFGGNDWEGGSSIQQTIDNGYIVIGTTLSNDSNIIGNHGGYDIWVLKLDQFGRIEWQNTFGGGSGDFSRLIRQTMDGGYIILGVSESFDGDVSGKKGAAFSNDYWVVKLNSIGKIEWQKTFGGSLNDLGTSLELTKDGGYIVSGFSYSNDGDVAGHHGTEYYTDYWVLKLDAIGKIEWQKSFGGQNFEEAYSIIQTIDGGYIIAGYCTSKDGDLILNNRESGYWIVKLNSNGNIKWQKVLGGSKSQIPNSIIQCLDGGYIIAGWTNSNDMDVSGNHGDNDCWIVKLNINGEIQWQKSIGGDSEDRAAWIQQTQDEGYIITGYSNSNNGDVSGNHGNQDIWVVKLSSEATSIQSDISDAVFSIVAPTATSNDIDMKKCLVGNVKDSIIKDVVFNIGSYKFKTDSIYFTGNDSSAFSLVSGFPPFEVEPSKGKFVEIRFKPNRVGLHSAKINIITQTDSLVQNIIGEGIQNNINVINKYIDFGSVKIGNYKDTLQAFTIQNLGSAITIDSIIHDYPNNVDFSTIKTITPVTMRPNDILKMDLKFKPSYIGRTNGTLKFYYNGVGSPAIVQLFGNGFDIYILTIVDTIDFGKVQLGKVKDTIQVPTIVNLSSDISIDSIVHINSNSGIFSTINKKSPLILQKEDSLKMDLEFKPSKIGKESGLLNFYFNDKSSPKTIYLVGEGFYNSNYVTLELRENSSYSGKYISIPIYLNFHTDLNYSNITGFKSDLTFNPSILFPMDYPLNKVNDSLGFITINNIPSTPDKDSILTIIKFYVGLGSAEECHLALTNFSALNGKVEIDTIGGTFKLLGVCKDVGDRLLNTDTKKFKLSIMPNPVGNSISVNFEAIEKGLTKLYISDITGNTIETLMNQEIFKIGLQSLECSTSNITSGEYFITVQSPTMTQTEKIKIVK